MAADDTDCTVLWHYNVGWVVYRLL